MGYKFTSALLISALLAGCQTELTMAKPAIKLSHSDNFTKVGTPKFIKTTTNKSRPNNELPELPGNIKVVENQVAY